MSLQLSQHQLVRRPRSLLSQSSRALTVSPVTHRNVSISSCVRAPPKSSRRLPAPAPPSVAFAASIGALAPPSGPFEYFLACLARSQTSPPSSRSSEGCWASSRRSSSFGFTRPSASSCLMWSSFSPTAPRHTRSENCYSSGPFGSQSCALVLQAAEVIAMGGRLKKVFDEDFKNVFHIVG